MNDNGGRTLNPFRRVGPIFNSHQIMWHTLNAAAALSDERTIQDHPFLSSPLLSLTLCQVVWG